ncbi:MAG: dehypoxanthine futalosine cyclase [Cyanobacteria bacterium HKST-UBA06]|nr:dehypoxanthine futalosine cyclase [Cyanobacteria bacterium HKST-UBA06]
MSSQLLDTAAPLSVPVAEPPKNRLTRQEALKLLLDEPLLSLGLQAEAEKAKRFGPDDPVTFVIDRNVNYTNVCTIDCMFCAFYRPPGHEEAYVHSFETLQPKIQELVDMNGTQLLLQGGVNPELPFSYYTDLISQIRAHYPELTIHGFSPTEIQQMADGAGYDLKTTLQKLVEAGLSSIPGAGGEILDDAVRQKVSRKKVDTNGWLRVMETAHQLGLRTTATMMFGMIEQPEHIINHLFRLREVQDRTGGFTAFIPWTFQAPNTRLAKLGHMATGEEYLRVLAVSRLVLDNFDHIQSSWLTQGLKLCQTGLYFGADDVGGLVLEENVVTQAGIKDETQSLETMVKLIHKTGKDAAQRDTAYNILRRFAR